MISSIWLLRVSLSLRMYQNAVIYLSALAAGCAACDGTAEQIGIRVVVDRLDAVVLEERIAEARGVRAGYRCLALLH